MKKTRQKKIPVCPYLGLGDDAHSSLAYPSESNYCHRCKPIAAIRLSHQEEFCLSKKYGKCAVFKNEMTRPPGHSRTLHARTQKKQGAERKNIFALVTVLTIAAVLFGWIYLSSQRLSQPVLAASTYTHTPIPTETNTLQPIFTETLQAPINTSTPTLHLPFFGSVTPYKSPTATPKPSSTPFLTKHQLNIPVGTDRKFIIRRVELGEQLEPYIQEYNTSLEAVKSLNYFLFLSSPVKRDMLIVFPVNFSDVSGMQVLGIYQIEETDRGINYETLAERFRVSLPDLKYYNGITEPGERPLVGEYYLIPQNRLIP